MIRSLTKMAGWLRLVVPVILIAAGVWWANATWQQGNRLAVRGTEVFRATLNARPRTLAGLSALDVDLSALDESMGELVFRLRRSSLGTTSGSYSWDWQSKSYQTANISFIDLSKRVREDSAVAAWDVDVATPGALRLKVWRETDSHICV